MAVLALTDASITINGVALSSKANSVTINYEVEAVEATGFGQQRNFIGGLQNNTVEIAFMQDFASAQTEATIYPLVGTTTTVVIKPTSAAVGTSNPSYTVTAYLASHTPVAGGVGEMAMTTLTLQGGSLVKATA
jgi:hypothetical protein